MGKEEGIWGPRQGPFSPDLGVGLCRQWLLLVLSDPPASLDTPSSLLYPSLSWTLSALCVWPLPIGGHSWRLESGGGVYMCVRVCVFSVHVGAYVCVWMLAYDCICGM